jgi:hypothetical protein
MRVRRRIGIVKMMSEVGGFGMVVWEDRVE